MTVKWHCHIVSSSKESEVQKGDRSSDTSDSTNSMAIRKIVYTLKEELSVTRNIWFECNGRRFDWLVKSL